MSALGTPESHQRARAVQAGRYLLSLAIWMLCQCSPLAAEPDFAAEIRPLLAKYCFDCHGAKKAKGDVNIERVTSPFAQDARTLWVHAHSQIRNGEMPPDDKPQPGEAERARLLAWLENAVERIDAAAPPNPGRPVLRRLTRFEYRNTIRDLTGLTFDFQFDPTTDFPADGADAGFDTNGAVLGMSPLHITQYLQAAERIVDRAIVADGLDGPRTWRWEAKDFPGGRATFTKPGSLTRELRIEQAGEYAIRTAMRCAEDNKKRAQLAVIADAKQEKFTFTRNGKESRNERKIQLPAGRVQIGLAFLYEQKDGSNDAADGPMQGEIAVDFIELAGPLGVSADKLPESHQRIFGGVRPVEGKSRRAAAEEVIAKFGARAFRRPLTADEVQKYARIFDTAESGTGVPPVSGANTGRTPVPPSFERSMKPALVSLLVAPHFLYRVEADRAARAADGSYALDGYELASRLSYFLWSSMPDDELLAAAATGKLTDDAELLRQTRRMLADLRSAALAQNFATQWLAIRNVENFQPEKKRFGEFGSALRNAVMQEPVLLFQSVLADHASLLTLLDADYTFANEDLAKLYKFTLPPLPDEEQKKESNRRIMRRVPLPPDAHRGGVMTTAAVLMASSHPTRTSLVKRGKWVLDNLLGTPPPPPAPNVAALPERAENGEKLTLRQQVELHRADPVCAACHKRMDPIGFALENFDAIGRWRDKDESKQAIDAAATLPDGTKVNGPDELKKLLLTRKDDFTRCLAEKLLTYALGRTPEPYDLRPVKRIVSATAADGYKLTTLVTEIVKSYPFHNRRISIADAVELPVSYRKSK